MMVAFSFAEMISSAYTSCSDDLLYAANLKVSAGLPSSIDEGPWGIPYISRIGLVAPTAKCAFPDLRPILDRRCFSTICEHWWDIQRESKPKLSPRVVRETLKWRVRSRSAANHVFLRPNDVCKVSDVRSYALQSVPYVHCPFRLFRM